MANVTAMMTTSWDDGHPCDLKLGGLLDKYGLTGTFYIPVRGRQEILSASQVRSLSVRFEVGCHTINHVSLTDVDEVTARAEINDCRPVIEDWTGRACKMFCFPQGQFSRRHVRMLQQAGYAGCRTVEFLSLSPPRQVEGVRVMPTTIQAFPHSMSDFLRNGAKRMAPRAIWRCLRYRPDHDWVLAAERLLEATAACGGVFHLWGHSWEIDGLNLWSQLESVLSAMAGARGRIRCVTNGEVCSR